MKKIISISEVVEAREAAGRTEEVLAGAEATFDESRSELVVRLGCSRRTSDARGHEEALPGDGLPREQTVRESVGLEEAPAAAREVFRSWVARVRKALPRTVNM